MALPLGGLLLLPPPMPPLLPRAPLRCCSRSSAGLAEQGDALRAMLCNAAKHLWVQQVQQHDQAGDDGCDA